MRPEELIKKYIENQDIAGAGLIVRKDGREVIHTLQGYADIEKEVPVRDNTIFQLASMTKPVIAVAAMQLVEQGKLQLDEKLERYIPEFASMKVADHVIGEETVAAYTADPENPMLGKMVKEELENIHLIDATNKITIRHLLNHSSGLGMGLISAEAVEACFDSSDKLADRVAKYASTPLDFEPGTMTGYSAMPGFDILGRVIEIISGKDLDKYICENITGPLGISDLGFEMTAEQRERMAVLYERPKDGRLVAVPEKESTWQRVDPQINGFYSGSAGMLGSLEAYDRFVQMLANDGRYEKTQILKPETIRLMARESASHHKELMPGCVWGLGMAVFSGLETSGRCLGEGSFGWSGAFGGHFYIDPHNRITMTLMVQRSDIGGATSYVSWKLEESIYQTLVDGDAKMPVSSMD